MTKPNNKIRGQYHSLKTGLFNSMATLFDHENAALAAGNQALADKLFKARVNLRDELMEVRKAEIAFLASEKTLQQQINDLEGAIATVKGGTRQMQNINTALQGASKVLGVLTSLVRLVT